MTDRRRFTGTCPTRHHVIVAYLFEEYPRWVSAPSLIKLELPYGITGSSGDVRARELARGECQESLRGKVERAEGRDLPGLDKRYTYYRYVPKEQTLTHQELLEANAENVRAFDARQAA